MGKSPSRGKGKGKDGKSSSLSSNSTICTECTCLNAFVNSTHVSDLFILTDLANSIAVNDIPHSSETHITHNNTTTVFDTLFDTGALQGNYIRRSNLVELLAAGLKVEECNVRVCGAFGDDRCQVANKGIVTNVLLNKNAVINKLHLPIDLTLKFTILDQLPFDMIIGRGDILKYNLMDTVVMHTTSTPVLIAAHHSQIELSTNGNSKPSSKSVLGENKPVDYHSNSPPSSCASTTLRVKPSQTVKPLTVENNISLDVKDSAESMPIQAKHPPLTGVAKSNVKCTNQSNHRVIINVENEAYQAESLSVPSSPPASCDGASTEVLKPCTTQRVTGGNTIRKKKNRSIKSTQSTLLQPAACVDASAIGINAPDSRSISD